MRSRKEGSPWARQNWSVLVLFENFEAGGVTTNEADGDSLFQIGFLEGFMKLFWVENRLLVHRRDDVARLDAFAGRNGIFFDRDHDNAWGHRNRETIGYFTSQRVNSEPNTIGSGRAGRVVFRAGDQGAGVRRPFAGIDLD